MEPDFDRNAFDSPAVHFLWLMALGQFLLVIIVAVAMALG